MWPDAPAPTSSPSPAGRLGPDGERDAEVHDAGLDVGAVRAADQPPAAVVQVVPPEELQRAGYDHDVSLMQRAGLSPFCAQLVQEHVVRLHGRAVGRPRRRRHEELCPEHGVGEVVGPEVPRHEPVLGVPLNVDGSLYLQIAARIHEHTYVRALQHYAL